MIVKELTDKDIYGHEYRNYVACKKRYRVVKGSIASKKSMNTARDLIVKLMEYPEANLVCFRKFDILHKTSCRAEIVKAIYALGVQDLWRIPKGELTITHKETGQVILFRGCQDTMNLASITVEHGYLNFAWIEEAYEITEEDFNRIDDRLRGQLPKGMYYQISLTFNPWHESSWLKKRFYTQKDADILDGEIPYKSGKQMSTKMQLAITRNYTCNEFLDQQFIDRMEMMRINEPNRYRIAGMGEWGVTGETIYTDWEVADFNWKEMIYEKDYITGKPIWDMKFGFDFGWSDEAAGVRLLTGEIQGKKVIYICEEFFKQRQSRDELAHAMRAMGWAQYRIHADSENPELINALKKAGVPGIFGVKKKPGSVYSGITKLRDYHIIVHPECPEFAIAIAQYAWKKGADGKPTMTPNHDFSHLMDAMRYAFVDEAAGLILEETDKQRPSSIQSTEQYKKRLEWARRRS